MTPPKVSVLVPTFNYARFLPAALDSVLGQDSPDFELLVADDCSTDDTKAAVAPFAAADPRVRYHRHSRNLGMVQNWNWCLSQARGQYVKFLFGDDKLVSPHALGQLVKLLDTSPGATLAGSARLVIDAESRTLESWDAFGAAGVYDGTQVIARCLHTGVNQVGEPSAVLFRRQDALRGFDTAYRQLVDLEMWFHLLEQGQFAYTPEPLCAFRVHAAQQTRQNRLDGLMIEEGARLTWNYHRKPYLAPFDVPGLLFAQVYRLRKRQLGPPLEMERLMMDELGQWRYRKYWLRHKVTRPWLNFRRSLAKRWHPPSVPP